MTGKTYIIIFCCCMYGVLTVRPTFFVITWRVVRNWVKHIVRIITAVTILTLVIEEFRKVAESGAPKMCAALALVSSAGVIAPTVLSCATLLSTPYRDMKNGDWISSGRQLEAGLAPASL